MGRFGGRTSCEGGQPHLLMSSNTFILSSLHPFTLDITTPLSPRPTLLPLNPATRPPRALITVSCLHQDMRTGVWRLLAAPKAASYMIGCWLSTQGNISLAATAFSPKLAM